MVWKLLTLIFLYFSFSVLLFLLVVFSYSNLNHSQLAPFRTLLQLPSPLLLNPQSKINLFLFFSLEMAAFNDVETGSCLSEMLSMMSCKSSIISVLNSCCSQRHFCFKISTWVLRFFSAGSLSLFFLIWFWISWNLVSK